MINRKKKKSTGKSDSRQGNEQPSSLFWLFISIIIFCIGGSLYYANTKYGIFNKFEAIEEEKLHQMMAQAHVLAMKYKNLTGSLPSNYQEVINSITTPSVTNSKGLHPGGSAGIGATNSIKLGAVTEAKPNLRAIAIDPASKKDAMVGIAQDMDPKNVAVFCKSFREVSPQADLILFMNTPIPEKSAELVKLHNVILIEYNLENLGVPLQHMSKFHASTLRWPLIKKYFDDSTKRDLYHRVWLADVRDTYFQSDPFSMLPVGSIGFNTFSGVESVSIEQCGWNGGWVKDCFGHDVLSRVGKQRIICSGVSMGDMESVYKYLVLMDDIISNKRGSEYAKASKFPQCERNGVDQGVHNVLVHTGSIPNLKIIGQQDGLVANMQAKVASIVGNQVYNRRNDKVAVVHQYDRFPDLQKHLFAKYVDWIDSTDPMAEWKLDTNCQPFQYKVNSDVLKGSCDFSMKGGAAGPSTCCSVCKSINGCRAFTYLSGACFLKSCSGPRGDFFLEGAVSGWMT